MDSFDRILAAIEAQLPTSTLRFDEFPGQRKVVERFHDELQPDDTVWDVGAGVGTFSLVAAETIGAENVVAFEFDDDRVATFVQRLEATGNTAVNLSPVALGARADKAGVVADRRTDVGDDRIHPASEAVELGYVDLAPTIIRFNRAGLAPAIIQGFSAEQLSHIRALFLPIASQEHFEWWDRAGFRCQPIVENSDPGTEWQWYVSARPYDRTAIGHRLRRAIGSLTGRQTNTAPATAESTTDRSPELDTATSQGSNPLRRTARTARWITDRMPYLVRFSIAFYLVKLMRLGVVVLVLVLFAVLTLVLVSLLSPFGVSERAIAAAAGVIAVLVFWAVGLRALFST